MAVFTIDALKTLLEECAGIDESVDFDGDIRDTSFEDLGYDSLALLNTTSRIEREYGVTLADDVVLECTTPHLLMAAVNDELSGQRLAS